ncbi:MAG: LacI family transcriptional regulator [Tissierellia bacterium]|nr:LacI family transcriptional regulator [Tissierellia bacterium]
MNIKEIAKKAGVSVATVSRVLNHPEVVQPETREHVLKVMKEFNYTPNWFARSLNLNRTHTIALMIPTVEKTSYQQIVSGVEQVAIRKKYATLLCNTHNDLKTELNYLDMIINRKIDGIILYSSNLNREQLDKFKANKTPLIFIGKNDVFKNENSCYINFEESAFKMTKHLIEMNHTNIDLAIDESSKQTNEYFVKGYKDAITSLNENMGKIHYCESSIEGGYLLTKKLIHKKELPMAIFSSDDEIAFGIMKAAREEKIDIPSRLAIAGFSDSPMCTLVTPELTSVEQPSKKLGMVAARMLFDIIEDEELALDTTHEIVLQSTIKIRQSCGNRKRIYELF